MAPFSPGIHSKAGPGIGASSSPGSLSGGGLVEVVCCSRAPFEGGGAKGWAVPGAGCPRGGAGPLCLLHRVSYIVTKVVQPLFGPAP